MVAAKMLSFPAKQPRSGGRLRWPSENFSKLDQFGILAQNFSRTSESSWLVSFPCTIQNPNETFCQVFNL
jgi:hypothetical protein